jgi:hypothetical protein
MEKLSELISKYPLLLVGAILVLISAIGLVPLGEKSYPISEPRQWIPLALGVVLISVYLIGYLRGTNKPRHSLDRVTGGINRPVDNTRVSRAIDAEGWVKNMKKEQHLWLVVEVGTHKWPKADPIRTDKDGGWRRTIFEDGLGTVFSLSLYVADAEGHVCKSRRPRSGSATTMPNRPNVRAGSSSARILPKAKARSIRIHAARHTYIGDFVRDHHSHGPLTADATEPAWNGYLFTVSVWSGVWEVDHTCGCRR